MPEDQSNACVWPGDWTRRAWSLALVTLRRGRSMTTRLADPSRGDSATSATRLLNGDAELSSLGREDGSEKAES